MTQEAVRTEAPTRPAWRRWGRALLALMPLGTALATFGVFFLDKNREARTVFGSGRGLVTVGVLVGGYLLIGLVLRRFARWQWLPPVALSLVVLALAAWIVRPYYVDETANRTLVSGPVLEVPSAGDAAEDLPAPAAGEQAPASSAVRVTSGVLVGIDHDASGTASLIRAPGGSLIARFANFDIEGSPDPQVYLAVGADVRRPEGTRLGPLTGNQGEVLDYAVPAGIRAGAGWTILIWCGQFGVPIANATQRAV